MDPTGETTGAAGKTRVPRESLRRLDAGHRYGHRTKDNRCGFNLQILVVADAGGHVGQVEPGRNRNGIAGTMCLITKRSSPARIRSTASRTIFCIISEDGSLRASQMLAQKPSSPSNRRSSSSQSRRVGAGSRPAAHATPDHARRCLRPNLDDVIWRTGRANWVAASPD